MFRNGSGLFKVYVNNKACIYKIYGKENLNKANSDLWGYEQSTDKTAKARWKLAYISALGVLSVLCDSRT